MDEAPISPPAYEDKPITIQMRYLADTIRLAESRGYLNFREVAKTARRAPKWLHQLQTSIGINKLAQRLQTEVPAALVEFYSQPKLIAFLELTGNETYFEQFARFDLGLSKRTSTVEHLPVRIHWDNFCYIALQHNAHSGCTIGARIDQSDPMLGDGEAWFEPVDDDEYSWEPMDLPFSQWLFNQVDGYESLLDYWEQAIRRVDSDPIERARVGEYSHFRKLPGMKDRLKTKRGSP